MVYREAPLLPEVQAFRRGRPSSRGACTSWERFRTPHLASRFSAADLFLTSSPAEGSNFALLEALACGTPPVASDIPAHRVLTGDGSRGAALRRGRRGVVRAGARRGGVAPLGGRAGRREAALRGEPRLAGRGAQAVVAYRFLAAGKPDAAIACSGPPAARVTSGPDDEDPSSWSRRPARCASSSPGEAAPHRSRPGGSPLGEPRRRPYEAHGLVGSAEDAGSLRRLARRLRLRDLRRDGPRARPGLRPGRVRRGASRGSATTAAGSSGRRRNHYMTDWVRRNARAGVVRPIAARGARDAEGEGPERRAGAPAAEGPLLLRPEGEAREAFEPRLKNRRPPPLRLDEGEGSTSSTAASSSGRRGLEAPARLAERAAASSRRTSPGSSRANRTAGLIVARPLERRRPRRRKGPRERPPPDAGRLPTASPRSSPRPIPEVSLPRRPARHGGSPAPALRADGPGRWKTPARGGSTPTPSATRASTTAPGACATRSTSGRSWRFP